MNFKIILINNYKFIDISCVGNKGRKQYIYKYMLQYYIILK